MLAPVPARSAGRIGTAQLRSAAEPVREGAASEGALGLIVVGRIRDERIRMGTRPVAGARGHCCRDSFYARLSNGMMSADSYS